MDKPPFKKQGFKKHRFKIRIIKGCMLALIVSLACYAAGVQYFAHMIRIEAAPALPHALPPGAGERAGIVVVTGSSGRIEAGLKLLAGAYGRRMLISGIGQGISKGDILRIITPPQGLSSDDVSMLMLCCVDLGPAAHNTRGNAAETSRWAENHALDPIILVTADFHLPRALIEFRRGLPGRVVLPHAVPTKGLGLNEDGRAEWWHSRGRLVTLGREYAKYLASLAGG